MKQVQAPQFQKHQTVKWYPRSSASETPKSEESSSTPVSEVSTSEVVSETSVSETPKSEASSTAPASESPKNEETSVASSTSQVDVAITSDSPGRILNFRKHTKRSDK